MPPKNNDEKQVEVNFQRFDMESIKCGKKLLFIGMSSSGKTVLVRDYLYHNQRTFPIGLVISPTEEVNNTFSKHIPRMLIHDEYRSEILEKLMERQKNLIKNKNENSDYENVNTNCIAIMDDCLSEAKIWKKDKIIQKIFYEARHFDLTFIMTLQYALGIPPNLRNNIDYVFLCYNNKPLEQKKLYEQFGGIFNNFQDFRNVFIKFTENYGCMIIKMNVLSSKIEDNIFYYKVDIDARKNWKTFRMFYRQLWEHNDEHLHKTEKEENNVIQSEKTKFKFIFDKTAK